MILRQILCNMGWMIMFHHALCLSCSRQNDWCQFDDQFFNILHVIFNTIFNPNVVVFYYQYGCLRVQFICDYTKDVERITWNTIFSFHQHNMGYITITITMFARIILAGIVSSVNRFNWTIRILAGSNIHGVWGLCLTDNYRNNICYHQGHHIHTSE